MNKEISQIIDANDELKNKLFENKGEWISSIVAPIDEFDFNLSFYKIKCGKVDNYIVKIKNYSDAKIMESKLPRGFSIMFNKQGEVLSRGTFYPKFENDRDQELEDILSEKDITFTLKYSGFNGCVVLYEDKGEICYFVTSKNSVVQKSIYIEGFQELLINGNYLTKDILRRMWNKGITSFSAEVMHKNDETHGYGYKESFFVVTCISKRIGSNIAESPIIYLEDTEMRECCSNFSLPCDKPITIDAEMIKKIQEHRDTLTYSKMKEIFNIDYELHHDKIDTDSIEGFVIKSSSGKILKYKCLFYVMSTMLLRPHVQNKSTDNSAIENFLNRWCKSTNLSISKKLARGVVYKALENLKFYDYSWIKASKHAIEDFKKGAIEPMEPISEDFNGRTIVVAIGVPGVGKSSTMLCLYELLKKNGEKNIIYHNKDTIAATKTYINKLNKECPIKGTILIDRNNSDSTQRSNLLSGLKKPGDRVIYFDFLGSSSKENIDIALSRMKERGLGHPMIKDPATAEKVMSFFESSYNIRDIADSVIKLNIHDPVSTKVNIISRALGYGYQITENEAQKIINRSEKDISNQTKVLYDKISVDYDRKLQKALSSHGIKITPYTKLHLTLNYHGDKDKNHPNDLGSLDGMGNEVEMKILGLGKSEKATALLIELPENIKCCNKHPHITLKVEKGCKPNDSNYIDYSKLIELKGVNTLKGIIGREYC